MALSFPSPQGFPHNKGLPMKSPHPGARVAGSPGVVCRFLALACLVAACAQIEPEPSNSRQAETAAPTEAIPLAVPNDNRTPAGTLRDGVLDVHLDARQVHWRPGNDPDVTHTVLAFAEQGGPARIPAPLIRVPQGTEVRITVRNSVPEWADLGLRPERYRREGMIAVAGPELTVHGLRAGTVADDVVHVPTGELREVRFRADRPGTFLYWGAMSRWPFEYRSGTDGQLTGAIVVDPAGTDPDPDERIFIITETDAFPDESRTPPGQDIFELTINGLSWPHTERLSYALGETVRWRWLNGSFQGHPMHLHGFHFRVTARGDGLGETIYEPDETQLAVTELMDPGSTLRMEWLAATEGNWLMHCHIVGHIIPFPERDEEMRAHDLYDVEQHALDAMDNLVIGITIRDANAEFVDLEPHQRLRLVAREQPVTGNDAVIRGFSLEAGAGEATTPLSVPGPSLILTRGETTSIAVVNEISEPTTVHWHGMELESVYDGVSGWSRSGSRVAPLVAPGESFMVQMRPPRAGTFIYHTHMDETDQLRGGMYGPLIVLEPGEVFDPEVDRVFVIGAAVHDGEYREVTINGELQPTPETFRVGTRYRLRFINISPEATVTMTLSRDDAPVRWTRLANDGADLPPALRTMTEARFRFGAGETYDFLWIPAAAGEATLELEWPFPTEPGERRISQAFQVR